MIVGAAVVELFIHGCHSLKAKRGVVRSIAQRVRNRFNLSVAEVGGQDTWQRAVLGLTGAGSDPVPLRRALERAVTFIEDTHLAEVRNADIEVMDLPHREGLWDPEMDGFEIDPDEDGAGEDERERWEE